VAASGEAIDWMTDYEQAVEQAKEEGTPLMVDVSAPWCSACKRLDETVFSRGDVVAASRQFVAVRVNGDERKDLVAKFEVSGYPTVVFLDPGGKELARARGAVPYQMMLEAMKKAAS
jgi:thiol:disulfide interchange protein